MIIKWPFTNLHTLNLNWILEKMKELEEKVKSYATNVSASATTGAAGSQASATVTGDLDSGLNFSFTIPRGATGPEGPTGPTGPAGAISNVKYGTVYLNRDGSIPAGQIAFLETRDPVLDLSDYQGIVGLMGYKLDCLIYGCKIVAISTGQSGVVRFSVLNETTNAVSYSDTDYAVISYY